MMQMTMTTPQPMPIQARGPMPFFGGGGAPGGVAGMCSNPVARLLKRPAGGRWSMHMVLGLLLLMLSPAAGEGSAGAADGAAFDRQLEHFTQLAIEGKTAEATMFLRQPGFLLAADHEGHTALFAAAVACNTGVLDQVLALSPQLNHRDRRGATALFYAASQGRNDVLRRLVQHGADVNLPDASGRTPLMVAVLMNHTAAAKLLLDAGAQVNRQDGDAATPLLAAVGSG